MVLAANVAVNVALLRPAVQSSTWATNVASRAVDGDLNTHSCTRSSPEPWLSVDLGTAMDVGRVCVVNDRNPTQGSFVKHCILYLHASLSVVLIVHEFITSVHPR